MTVAEQGSQDGAPVKTGRRRGTHDTRCTNPNPEFIRPAAHKSLPGALGLLAGRAAKRKIHRDPYFVQLRSALGRHRDFRPERRNLIDALCRAMLNCVDLSTQVPTICLERLAADLNVTCSRVSRLVNQVLIPAGLMHVQAEDQARAKDADFGMVWDRAHSIWFPKVLVLTDKFFELMGADEKLMTKLIDQFAEALQANKSGLAAKGELLSLKEARRRIQQRAFNIAWERRKGAAAAQKRKARLHGMDSVDDRLHYAAELLRSQNPAQCDRMSPEQFKDACWQYLHKQSAATVHSPAKT